MSASLISLQESMNELDREERDKDAASLSRVRKAHLTALDSIREYAVEFDAEELSKFQQHISSIRDLLEKDDSVGKLDVSEASLRGELRSYQSTARKYLEELRTELNAAVSGLQSLCIGVEENGARCQEVVKGELTNLHFAAECDDIGVIRKAIAQSEASISAGWEQMQKSNAVMVAQLRDEIRSLHREMAEQKRALMEDKVSGAWSRAKIDSRIEDLLRTNEGFCVAVVWISNLKRLTATCPEAVVGEALRAFVQRFKNTVGESLLGRFGPEEFAVILETDLPTARLVAGEINQKLNGSYAIQHNGIAQRLVLRVSVGIVDYVPGTSPERLYHRLQNMSGIVATNRP